MALDIAKMAEEEGTRKIFLGHTVRDVYLAFGQHWGPGVVDVPNSIADVLAESVRRVSRGRREEDRVNPEGPAPPRPVQLDKASDEELLEVLRQRGLLPPGAPVGPLGEGVVELSPAEASDPNAQSGLEKAAQAASQAAAAVANQSPPLPPLTPPPIPPTIMAPGKPGA